jgi:thioredoxin reductase
MDHTTEPSVPADTRRQAAPDTDAVVVGGGAAGLSAALVLARARRAVVVVDAGRPRNAPAAHMHGFLGSDGMSPAELLERGRAEVEGYGGRLVAGTVTSVATQPDPHARAARFVVRTDDGAVLTTRRLLVTTGLRDVIPDVPGLRERWGRDVLHCPYCHGHEVRDRPLAVLGATPESLAHAHLVRQWSSDVVLLTHGMPLGADQLAGLRARGIRVVDGPALRVVVADDRLTGVEVDGHGTVPCEAVFVRPQFVPNDSLLTDLGCATDGAGWVTVDASGRTSIPGVWAAGNAVNPRAQVITAAGEGSAAAISLNNDLVEEDLLLALTHP